MEQPRSSARTTRWRRLAALTALASALLALPGLSSPAQAAAPVVGIAATPDGTGYWQVGADGAVTTAGTARSYGSMAGRPLNRPVVGMAATPTGRGYWLVATDGGIFSFGDARFYGSTGGMRLNRPIVGIAGTPTGRGYWLVASDGGIFSFGDARFYGSTGSIRLNQPIVGMAGTPTGRGYWLVASDGGIFGFGDARFYGSTGSIRLNQPITGMSAAADARGYILVARDGGVFPFGSAAFYGSAAGACAGAPAVGIATSQRTRGYWITFGDGRTYALSPSSRPPLCGPSGTSRADVATRDYLTRLNAERAARGLPALAWDPALGSYAASWAREMAVTGFRHSDIGALLRDGRLNAVAENIAAGSGSGITAGVLHVAWMRSDGHRANMLSRSYDVVGIGVYCGGDGSMHAVQVFGHRSSAGGVPASGGLLPVDPIARADRGTASC